MSVCGDNGCLLVTFAEIPLSVSSGLDTLNLKEDRGLYVSGERELHLLGSCNKTVFLPPPCMLAFLSHLACCQVVLLRHGVVVP